MPPRSEVRRKIFVLPVSRICMYIGVRERILSERMNVRKGKKV